MKRKLLVSAIVPALLGATILTMLSASAQGHDSSPGWLKHHAKPRPTPTAIPTPTPTATPTPTPTATPTPTPKPTPTPTPGGALPNFSHVFVIVMENEESNSITGNASAPYINGLAKSHGLAASYFAISHPSLPNYLTLTAGSTFGIASDCTGCYVGATNIADQVQASGRSWKAYMESMPSSYYIDIRTDAARCTSHVVPFTQLSTDLSAGTVPNFAWITPNMCSDMHDCSVATGDGWLGSVVPSILASSAFQNGGVLFITWDEGASSAGCCGNASGGQVASLVIAPNSIVGLRSITNETHYSLLRTIEDAWGLAPLGQAANAAAMREYFR